MEEGSLRVDANVSVRRFGYGVSGHEDRNQEYEFVRAWSARIEVEFARPVALLEAVSGWCSKRCVFDAHRNEVVRRAARRRVTITGTSPSPIFRRCA